MRDNGPNPALTSGLTQRIAMMFAPDEIELVSSLLTEGCSSKLTRFPVLLDRIRYAVLKLSGGNLDELRKAIRIAQRDWRDALVWAGFGQSLDAHEILVARRSDRAARLAGTGSAWSLLGGIHAAGRSVGIDPNAFLSNGLPTMPGLGPTAGEAGLRHAKPKAKHGGHIRRTPL